MIVGIDFGFLTQMAVHGHAWSSARVCVYHLDKESVCVRCQRSRVRLRQMFADCVRYQTDFVGGGANAASYSWKTTQLLHAPTVSSLTS